MRPALRGYPVSSHLRTRAAGPASRGLGYGADRSIRQTRNSDRARDTGPAASGGGGHRRRGSPLRGSRGQPTLYTYGTAATWSPLSVNGVNVSTWSEPLTTVPADALGVIWTVMVPVWPGDSSSGVNVAVGSTVSAHTSPVLDVTAESNSCVTTSAATLALAGGAPVSGNGPCSSGIAAQMPGVTCGAVSMATDAVPPFSATPSGVGCPKFGWMSMTIGTVAWAATISWPVWVGTANSGTEVRGSGTLLAFKPSNGSTPCRSSRGSTKKNSLATPVFVTWRVAVTGWPAGSTVLAECGTPPAVTCGAVNVMEPVYGSWKRVPSMLRDRRMTSVHRPFSGTRSKNCICVPRRTRPNCAFRTASLSMSSASPDGVTRKPITR